VHRVKLQCILGAGLSLRLSSLQSSQNLLIRHLQEIETSRYIIRWKR